MKPQKYLQGLTKISSRLDQRVLKRDAAEAILIRANLALKISGALVINYQITTATLHKCHDNSIIANKYYITKMGNIFTVLINL